MRKAVLLDRATFSDEVDFHLPEDISLETYENTKAEEVATRLDGAKIAITNKVPLTAETFAKCPSLRFVAVAATGYDRIDVEAARTHGVVVSNVRGYAVNSVPEHAMALILALSRGLMGYRADIANGEWQKAGTFTLLTQPVRDLNGLTLALFGRGSIAQSIANMARAFGMKVIFAGRKHQSPDEDQVAFDEALAQADILSLHLPLTNETRNLFTLEDFQSMARHPLFINTARGGIVDENVLVEAYSAGYIRGMGVDVFSEEPPARDNPLLALQNEPNVIFTPHSAWASLNAQQEVWDQTVENIVGYMRGAALRVL